MSKKINPIRAAQERERAAEEALLRKKLGLDAVEESYIEQIEKKAKNLNHEIKVKDEPERKAFEMEIARRAVAKRHLLPFVVRTVPGYIPGWVHMDICRRLEQFLKDVEAKKSPRLILQVPPRTGKQLAHSTPVLTTSGWKTHGDLVVGDRVFHPSGKDIEVLALSGDSPNEYTVTTSHGEAIECHGNHEWTVYDRSCNAWKTLTTKQMFEGRKSRSNKHIGLLIEGEPGKRGSRYTYQLPNIEAVEFSEKDMPVDPYVLGAWLGDGSRGKGCITGDKKDYPITDAIETAGYKKTSVCVHNTTGVLTTYFSGPRPGVMGRLGKELRGVGVYDDKFIPEIFLRGSIAQRLELLAGLVDTDGHQDQAGRYSFTSADRKLIDGVVELTTQLGFRPQVIEEQPRLSSSGIQGKKVYWKVVFQPTRPIPCRLPRKQNTRIAKQRRVAIADIQKTAKEMGRCIQVDSEDGLYLAGKKLVPTHNSELASINFPAWVLGHHPEWDIISTSYAASLAEGFSRKARDKVDTSEYKTVFDTRLDDNAKSIQTWGTNKGGTYNAAGVGGGIVGKGAHIGIIDDPFKSKDDAYSETNRESVWDWYTTAFYTRLAPGGGVLIIMQRWHEDDLAGRLIKKMNEDPDADQFDVVHYPAIAEGDEEYRKEGEALHPERYNVKQLMQIKKNMHPSDWEALYQQNPTMADGDFFTRDMFHEYKPKDRPPLNALSIYQAWDLAIGTKEVNDYSVGACIGIDENDNHYVIDVIKGHWGAFDLVENILDFAKRYNPAKVGIETSQIEMAIGPLLRKRMAETNNFIHLERLKPGRRDKMMRARPIQGRMQQGMVLWPKGASWFQGCQNEMLAFPAGKHDDQVDALAWVYLMLETMRTPYIPKPKKKKGWRDKLRTKSRTSSSAMSS